MKQKTPFVPFILAAILLAGVIAIDCQRDQIHRLEARNAVLSEAANMSSNLCNEAVKLLIIAVADNK